MNTRIILTTGLLITGLTATSGCDSAFTPEDTMGEVGTAQMALIHDTGSTENPAQGLESQQDPATIMDFDHTIQSPLYYPNRDLASCLADGRHASTEVNLYTRPTDCCRVHFEWKYDACVAGTRLVANEVATTDEVEDHRLDSMGLIHDEDDLRLEVPHAVHIPNVEDEPAEETAETDELDTIMIDDSEEDVEFETPNSLNTDDFASEDEMDEEEMDEVSIYGDSATCPEGWNYQEIDCTQVTASHALAHRCAQLIVPTTTALCGDHDRDGVVCLVPDHDTSSSFGMGDAPGATQQRCINPEAAF